MISQIIQLAILWLAILFMHKAAGKIMKTLGSTNDVIIDLADKYGWFAHGTAAYIAATLLNGHTVIQALSILALFAYYEIMHYLFPNSRPAIIEFASIYIATIMTQAGINIQLPIKI